MRRTVTILTLSTLLASTLACGGPAPSAGEGAAANPSTAVRGSGNEPVTPAPPSLREVTLPTGTTLALTLDTRVSSVDSRIEDTVRATLRTAVDVDGATVLPAGTPVAGVVTAVERSGKVKGRAFVAFRFTSLVVDDEPLAMRTAAIRREAPGTKAKDAKTIAIPAAGGAVVGGIVGGKKGAAIGGAAGGGAGTAVVLTTRGEEVDLPAGARVSARLLEPLTIAVPVNP